MKRTEKRIANLQAASATVRRIAAELAARPERLKTPNEAAASDALYASAERIDLAVQQLAGQLRFEPIRRSPLRVTFSLSHFVRSLQM